MDLTTSYLGLKLRNPCVVGASPFCDSLALAHALEDAGAAAVVMRSLFEEQFQAENPPPPRAAKSTGSGADFHDGEIAEYVLSPTQYLAQLRRLKGSLAIPVIASLNATQSGPWLDFARALEDAGADAIELNLYRVVTDSATSAEEVELEMIHAAAAVAGAVTIPVAVKLGPFHSAVAQLATALELAGAAGIVLFNRFYQSDVNVDEIAVQPILRLSEPSELPLRLRWLAILSPHLQGSLAATGGIHSSSDIAKCILTGAHAVQLVSILLKQGPRYLTVILNGLQRWMREQGYKDLNDFRGRLNLTNCRNPAALERANYISALQLWRT